MIRDKNQLKFNCYHKSKKSLSLTHWFSWLSKVCSKSIKEGALLNLRTVINKDIFFGPNKEVPITLNHIIHMQSTAIIYKVVFFPVIHFLALFTLLPKEHYES